MKGITIYNIFSILLLAIPWSIGAAFIIYLLFTKNICIGFWGMFGMNGQLNGEKI